MRLYRGKAVTFRDGLNEEQQATVLEFTRTHVKLKDSRGWQHFLPRTALVR